MYKILTEGLGIEGKREKSGGFNGVDIADTWYNK